MLPKLTSIIIKIKVAFIYLLPEYSLRSIIISYNRYTFLYNLGHHILKSDNHSAHKVLGPKVLTNSSVALDNTLRSDSFEDDPIFYHISIPFIILSHLLFYPICYSIPSPFPSPIYCRVCNIAKYNNMINKNYA